MAKSLRDYIIITLSTLLLTFLVWLPHQLALNSFYKLDFSAGFNTIYRNFDGMEYIIIAKTLYDPQKIASLPQDLPASYFPAHFPGYALLILAFAPILGFLKSMLFVSVLSTILAALLFYKLLKDFKLTENPLLLSLLFLILPARWLIVHSVGSSEPTFILFVLATIYSIMKFEGEHPVDVRVKKYYWIILAGLAGFAAQFTRPPGALLSLAIFVYLLWKILKQVQDDKHKNVIANTVKQSLLTIRNYFPLFLLPLGLFVVFYWYQIAFGDFFMYFKTGDNIHLTFPPYHVFNVAEYWVGDMWLEDIVYIFLIGFSGTFLLFKKGLKLMGLFTLIYMLAGISIAHRDISRYLLPIFPFVLIAFEKFLTSKEFKWAAAIVLLGIYLYSQNFIIQNVAPYPNVELFN
jgi:hypothetical protein